nr:hypothetical protein BaRGS_000284 [Batillaria attramentaria]
MDAKIVSSLLVVLVCCLHPALPVEKHMFTSYANLLKLYYMEEECLSNVDVFLREELAQHGDVESADAAHNLTSLRKVVEEAKEVHRQVGSNPEEYLSNPVNVYRLARRLLPGWKDAIDVIRKSKACREWHIPHVVSRLANMEENLPTDDDLRSLGYSLVTIQHTQSLRTADVIAGRIGGHVALSPLSPEEQFQIAKLAVDEDDYYYAAQWLKHLANSGQLSKFSKERHGFNATNVLGMLASAYFRINMVPDALKATEELLKKDPRNMVAQTNKQYFEDHIARKGKGSKGSQPIRYGKDDIYRRNYEALCRVADRQQRQLLSKLRKKFLDLPYTVTPPFQAGEGEGTVLFYFPSMKKFHCVCPVAYGTEWLAIQSFFEKPARTKCRPHENPELRAR